MNTLPISSFTTEIVEAVADTAVVIIKADTGAGKSTQVPQMLHAAGYDVVITEPRRIAAQAVAERVAEEMGGKLGGLVGFQTAFEHCSSNDTEILFCTDGLQLVRTLSDKRKKTKPKVLIIDEAHEWNLNIETLVAWCKKRIQEDWQTKLVIMSATFEEDTLATYFEGKAKVLNIPGRMFPVIMQQNSREPIIVIEKLVKAGRNVLVFVPGKKEIVDLMDNCELFIKEAVVLPLHGELNFEEQKKCFQSYSLPKVVIATNVAQTSITIDDIDAVVDTGLERRIEVDNGVEGLFLRHVSRADCIQRKGRAGRTKEGIYVLCSEVTLEERNAFALPEIQRSILNQVVLRLAAVDIDAIDLDFFHQPDIQELIIAKENLTNIGALKNNKITIDGKRMSKMPISCNFARMILEAEKLGVVDDVIIITAILEAGSLINHKDGFYYEHTKEKKSDLLAELDVYKKFENNRQIDFKKENISAKSFFKTREIINKLRISLQEVVDFGSTGDRDSIVLACASGMVDHVYYYGSNGFEFRQIDKKSCCSSCSDWVVGFPKTIEFRNGYGLLQTLNLLSMVSRIDIKKIIPFAPHLFEQKEGEVYYTNNNCHVEMGMYYKGRFINSEDIIDNNHPEYEKLKNEYETTQKQIDKSNERYEREEVIYEGHYFHADYHYRETCKVITMLADELFSLTGKSIPLQNGKFAKISCLEYSQHIGNSITATKEIYLQEKERETWKTFERQYKKFTTNVKDVIEWFSTTGKITVISEKELYGNQPKQKYGYLFIEEKNKEFIFSLGKNVECLEKTNKILHDIFDKEISQKYSNNKFYTQTTKGKEAKMLFDDFVKEMKSDINPTTLKEKIEQLSEIFTDIEKEYLVEAAQETVSQKPVKKKTGPKV